MQCDHSWVPIIMITLLVKQMNPIKKLITTLNWTNFLLMRTHLSGRWLCSPARFSLTWSYLVMTLLLSWHWWTWSVSTECDWYLLTISHCSLITSVPGHTGALIVLRTYLIIIITTTTLLLERSVAVLQSLIDCMFSEDNVTVLGVDLITHSLPAIHCRDRGCSSPDLCNDLTLMFWTLWYKCSGRCWWNCVYNLVRILSLDSENSPEPIRNEYYFCQPIIGKYYLCADTLEPSVLIQDSLTEV